MILGFLTGCLLVLTIYILRIILVLVISKLSKEYFLKNFEFDFKQYLFETVLFGLIFLSFNLIHSNFNAINFIQHICSVLLILIIPSYVFVLQPIFFIIDKKNFLNEKSDCLTQVKNYKIKTIDKELLNAYATGILPLSKTILIGKPLIANLTKEELYSIQLHEAGHLENNHLKKIFFVNLLLSVLFYFTLIIRSNYFLTSNEVVNVLVVGVLGFFYGLMLWLIPGKIQYKFEFEADKYSVENNGKENLISALKKLDVLSKGEVSKGGITHPTLYERVKHINSL